MDDNTITRMNEYYIAKSKYERLYNEAKKRIMGSDLSKKEQIKKISNLKHTCIFCKSSEGMTFTSIKKNDDMVRELSYKCNKKPSCKSETIEFIIGKHADEQITNLRIEYNNSVDVLLKTKYDVLFDYVESDPTIINTITDNYKITNEELKDTITSRNEIINNPELHEKLQKLYTELHRLIDSESSDEKITGIFRLEDQIQKLKHSTMSFGPLNMTETFNHPYTLQDLVFYYSLD